MYSFKRFRDYAAVADAGGGDAAYRQAGFWSPVMRRDHEAFYRNFCARARKGTGITLADRLVALVAESDMLARQSGGFPQDVLMDMFVLKVFSFRRGAG
jgi:hypothetical protein